jgi:peptide/nickel transport system substrate-binding protein
MTPDPYYATSWFITEQAGVWNWERFANAEFDKIHKDAQSESDLVKRDAMYQRAQDLMEESGAYKFITHEATPNVYRNTIVPALRPDGMPLYRYFKKD